MGYPTVPTSNAHRPIRRLGVRSDKAKQQSNWSSTRRISEMLNEFDRIAMRKLAKIDAAVERSVSGISAETQRLINQVVPVGVESQRGIPRKCKEHSSRFVAKSANHSVIVQRNGIARIGQFARTPDNPTGDRSEAIITCKTSLPVGTFEADGIRAPKPVHEPKWFSATVSRDLLDAHIKSFRRAGLVEGKDWKREKTESGWLLRLKDRNNWLGKFGLNGHQLMVRGKRR